MHGFHLRWAWSWRSGTASRQTRRGSRYGSDAKSTSRCPRGTTLVLEERSVLQQLGEVYYQVRDVFSVQYGTVQTAVEGTEFAIAGEGAEVAVRVTEGAVQVSNAGEAVRVKRGQEVRVLAASPPPSPTTMAMAATRSARSTAWTLGRPRLQLGLLAGGGVLGTDAGAQMQTFAAVRVLPFLNVVADATQGYSPSSIERAPASGSSLRSVD